MKYTSTCDFCSSACVPSEHEGGHMLCSKCSKKEAASLAHIERCIDECPEYAFDGEAFGEMVREDMEGKS